MEDIERREREIVQRIREDNFYYRYRIEDLDPRNNIHSYLERCQRGLSRKGERPINPEKEDRVLMGDHWEVSKRVLGIYAYNTSILLGTVGLLYGLSRLLE